MITTRDEDIHREALIYRDQGKEGFTTNYHVRLGYNWRMSEPHAVIGRAQLRRLPEFIERRQDIAQIYAAGLAALGAEVQTLSIPPGVRSNYYKYIAMLDPGIDRAELKRVLRERFEVGLSGEVYETPCHQQPIFADQTAGPLPRAEEICARHICLPISAKMESKDAEYVLDSLRRALALMPAAGAAVRD